MKSLISSLVAAAGLSLTAFSAFAQTSSEPVGPVVSIYEGNVVEVSTSGTTTGDLAFNISGKVMLGTNSCEAEGLKAEIRSYRSNGARYFYATTVGTPTNEICTREWNPVYADVSAGLRMHRGEKVIVRSIDIDRDGVPGDFRIDALGLPTE